MSASVYFTSALLLQDANVFSGELAKASVALAMAAYSRDYVNSLLSGMGFTCYDNTSVYDRSANQLTLNDNDYVSYTIAYQTVTHPITGEDYIIYCVPVQGTTENAEWFSNFNLGTGTEHEGFRQASLEVYNKLQGYFAADGSDADHRIVWLTGHSRGAACANLIAGWLSSSGQSYTVPEHVFGYTFACPAVSLNADTSLTNIYNFNNAGDMVTMLPMAEWGYLRYGQSITLDTSATQLANVKQQFKTTTGKTYAGEPSGKNYNVLLMNIIGPDRNVYYDSAYLKLTLGLAAWALGGKTDAKVGDVVAEYIDGIDFILETLYAYDTVTDLNTYLKLLTGSSDEYDELSAWAYQAYADTQAMTDEEFQEFMDQNADKILELEEKSEIDVVSSQSLLYAYDMLRLSSLDITSVAKSFQAAMDLVTDENGNVLDKIIHGHTQSTYTVWINSLYYGYRGWYGSNVIQSAHIDGNYMSVGSQCFYKSTSLKTLTLDDPGLYVGSNAFAYCSGLREVTMPADYAQSGHPFSNTTGVTTIHYTVGQTGVMPDRTSDSSKTNYYTNTLEYASRDSIQSIDFEEGITHIGNYLFGAGSSSLKTVKLPSTLETIGSYAFYHCTGSPAITFWGSAPKISSNAFYNTIATCQYLAWDASWTEDVLQNYGGTLTWVPFDPCEGEHTVVTDAAVEATCTTDGLTEGSHCSVCRKVIVAQEVIPAYGHTEVIINSVAASCTENGMTEGKCCAACQEILIAQEVIPALGHNMVDGTCTRCGFAEEVGGPQIVSQPVDYVGLVGDNATFTVVAEGEGLTYQWYFYDTEASEWKKSPGNTSDTITVEFKAYRVDQEYRCEITDAEGNTVTTDVVKIVAKVVDLVIVTQPVDYVGAVNDNVSFTVEATGNGLQYQWYFSDDDGATWAKSGTPGFATATLEPILRTYRDGYLYYCEITDIFGNTVNSDVVSMTVKASEVTITKAPVDVNGAKLGELYYFETEATGDNLEFRWEFSDDGGETWQLSWNQGYNTATLGVRMNANRDGYLYRCKIVSGLKAVVYTDPVSLNLQEPSAVIVGQSGNVAIIANQTATFTVDAEGTDLSYLWYRSNDKGATWTQTYLSGYNTDTLSFVGTAARAAMYMCKVTDGSGKAVWSEPVKLQILSAELKILSQPESITCANGATATFTVKAQGDSLKYQWYASADGGESWTISYLGGYNTDTLSFSMTAARASKLYKCVITDAAGNTVETNTVSVTIG